MGNKSTPARWPALFAVSIAGETWMFRLVDGVEWLNDGGGLQEHLYIIDLDAREVRLSNRALPHTVIGASIAHLIELATEKATSGASVATLPLDRLCCPKCGKQFKSSCQWLARHLIRNHGWTPAAAVTTAEQEWSRVYPLSKAQEVARG